MSRKPCQHINPVRVLASIRGVPIGNEPDSPALICRNCHVAAMGNPAFIPIGKDDVALEKSQRPRCLPEGASLTILETT